MPLCPCAALDYPGTQQWVTASHSVLTPKAQAEEVEPFVRSLKAVPKSGLHNPLKNPDRRAAAPCCSFALPQRALECWHSDSPVCSGASGCELHG